MDPPNHHRPARWALTIAIVAVALLTLWAALPLLYLLLFSGTIALTIKLTAVVAIALCGRFSRHPPDDPP